MGALKIARLLPGLTGKPLEFSLIKNICGGNVPLGNVEWR